MPFASHFSPRDMSTVFDASTSPHRFAHSVPNHNLFRIVFRETTRSSLCHSIPISLHVSPYPRRCTLPLLRATCQSEWTHHQGCTRSPIRLSNCSGFATRSRLGKLSQFVTTQLAQPLRQFEPLLLGFMLFFRVVPVVCITKTRPHLLHNLQVALDKGEVLNLRFNLTNCYRSLGSVLYKRL